MVVHIERAARSAGYDLIFSNAAFHWAEAWACKCNEQLPCRVRPRAIVLHRISDLSDNNVAYNPLWLRSTTTSVKVTDSLPQGSDERIRSKARAACKLPGVYGWGGGTGAVAGSLRLNVLTAKCQVSSQKDILSQCPRT